MFIKLFTFYVYLQSALCGCFADKWSSDFERLRKNYKVTIERVGKLDEKVTESSGLAHATDSAYYTHPDGGSLRELYLFNLQGKLLQTIPLPLPNHDWEDLAQDEKGNMFIGDFGNNSNQRRNLRIYKLKPDQTIDTLHFSYQDQSEFPPPRKRRHFDTEAFFYSSDSLYLFTKSRALFKPVTQLYSLPAQAGNYSLLPREALRLKSAVTAADKLTDQNRFALLGYGRLYLFEPDSEAITFDGKRYCLPLGRTGQAEAVLFLKPHQLLITNENGKLYLVTLEPKNRRNRR